MRNRVVFCLRPLLVLLVLLPGMVGHSVRAGGGGAGAYDVSGIRLLVETGDPRIDLAERYALYVLGADFNGVAHVAAAGYYVNPWVRDSYAWGMIPSLRDSSVGSYPTTELAYWLNRQQPYGGWLTAPKSGYFDETPELISAVLDAYRVTGDYRMLHAAVPRLERGWHWLEHSYIRPTKGSDVLLYANVPPHIASDWADQVARRGYATQLEALWYWGTRCLGIIEMLVDHAALGHFYLSFADHIRADINRLLWTDTAPFVRDAPPVGAFGHYRSWVGPRDYFELDSNFLCIVYGIADRRQSASIDAFVWQHAAYLLGVQDGTGVPARVVYGDYAPADYAFKRNYIGADRYQSAYWPTVGALAAIGLARSGNIAASRVVLARLSEVFDSAGEIDEWYSADGNGHGAPKFGWAARMFIVALYVAYLGIEPNEGLQGAYIPTGLRLRSPAGAGKASLTYAGHRLTVRVAGHGSRVRATVGSDSVRGPIVPGDILCAGCTVTIAWAG